MTSAYEVGVMGRQSGWSAPQRTANRMSPFHSIRGSV